MIKRVGLFVLVAIVMLIMSVDNVEAAENNYYGSRWQDEKICVQNVTNDPTIHDAVYRAVDNMRDATVINITYKSSCAGYAQRIQIRDADYGRTSWIGLTVHNGWAWGKTDSGLWTYFNKPTVTIQLNEYYTHYNSAGWQHVAVHELGHAVGLDHDTHCDSVMSQNCPQLKSLTARDVRNVNTIYGW